MAHGKPYPAMAVEEAGKRRIGFSGSIGNAIPPQFFLPQFFLLATCLGRLLANASYRYAGRNCIGDGGASRYRSATSRPNSNIASSSANNR